MIVDHISNYKNYEFLSDIYLGLKFLSEQNLSTLNEGRIEIEKNIYAFKEKYLTGVNFKYGGYESHKSHIDIQYAIKGLEKIRVSTQDINSIIYQKPIEDDRYITKFKKPDNEIIIGKGVFAIMFPSDLHAPQLSVDKSELIEKITIKIEINESNYPFTRKRWK